MYIENLYRKMVQIIRKDAQCVLHCFYFYYNSYLIFHLNTLKIYQDYHDTFCWSVEIVGFWMFMFYKVK